MSALHHRPAEQPSWPLPDRVISACVGHVGEVCQACFSVDGRYVLSAGADRSVRLWNPWRVSDTGNAHMVREFTDVHTKPVRCVALCGQGVSFASGGDDSAVMVWDIPTATAKQRVFGHASRVNALAMNAAGTLLFTGSYDTSVRLYDLRAARQQRPVQTLSEASDAVTCVALGPADSPSVLAGSVDGCLRTYDMRAGQLRTDTLGAPITGAQLGLDGATVAASCLPERAQAEYGTVRVLDTASGSLLNLFAGHAHAQYASTCALVHADAGVLAPGEDGRLAAWDMLLDGAVVPGSRALRAPPSPRWSAWLPSSPAVGALARSAAAGAPASITGLVAMPRYATASARESAAALVWGHGGQLCLVGNRADASDAGRVRDPDSAPAPMAWASPLLGGQRGPPGHA